MKTKEYYVIDKQTQGVEYVIESPDDEDIFILRRSSNNNWSDHVQGETIMTVLNSGNGYRITWSKKPEVVLDYGQIMELTIMLNFLNKFDNAVPMNYHVVDANDMIETV